MEDLTKHQMVLLNILVSFVVSIATSITMFTLLDQAPPMVTQTINRVVERTIEKVAPASAPSLLTKEVTVVVKESDLITDAVARNLPRTVKLFATPAPDAESNKPVFLGTGFVLSGDGLIITDKALVREGGEYQVSVNDATVEVKVIYEDKDSNVAVLLSTATTTVASSAADMRTGDKLKLGESVFAIGGGTSASISKGIVGEIERSTVSTTTTQVSKIRTTLALHAQESGAPAFDLDGKFIGMAVVRDSGQYILPVSKVLEVLDSARKASKEKEKTAVIAVPANTLTN